MDQVTRDLADVMLERDGDPVGLPLLAGVVHRRNQYVYIEPLDVPAAGQVALDQLKGSAPVEPEQAVEIVQVQGGLGLTMRIPDWALPWSRPTISAAAARPCLDRL